MTGGSRVPRDRSLLDLTGTKQIGAAALSAHIRTRAYHRQHSSTTTRLHLILAAKLCNEWGPPLSSTERSLVRMVREGLNKAPNRASPANAESAISSSRPAKAPSNANPRTAAPTPPHTASPPSPDRLRCKTTARSAPAASNPRVTDAGPGPLSDKTAQPATPDAPRESTRPSSPETTRDGCAARAEALADLAVADPAP